MNIGDLARFQPWMGILVPAKLHEQVCFDTHFGLYLQQLTIFICSISLLYVLFGEKPDNKQLQFFYENVLTVGIGGGFVLFLSCFDAL